MICTYVSTLQARKKRKLMDLKDPEPGEQEDGECSETEDESSQSSKEESLDSSNNSDFEEDKGVIYLYLFIWIN